jgi:hypothetical protein
MVLRNLILSCVLWSSAVQAHVVGDALKVVDRSKTSDWHYRVSETDNDKLKAVALFDPSKDKKQQWKLESYEGKEPTQKEIQHFLERKERAQEEKLLDQIDEASLVALDAGNNPKRWSFRLRKNANLDGVPPEKISGIISLNEQGDLQRIEYKNNDAFRAKLVMKINKFFAVTEFEKQKNGDILLKSESIDTELSFMGKDVKVKKSTVYEFLRNK